MNPSSFSRPEAIGGRPPVPERVAGVEEGPRRVVDLPNDVEALRRLVVDTVGSLPNLVR